MSLDEIIKTLWMVGEVACLLYGLWLLIRMTKAVEKIAEKT